MYFLKKYYNILCFFFTIIDNEKKRMHNKLFKEEEGMFDSLFGNIDKIKD